MSTGTILSVGGSAKLPVTNGFNKLGKDDTWKTTAIDNWKNIISHADVNIFPKIKPRFTTKFRNSETKHRKGTFRVKAMKSIDPAQCKNHCMSISNQHKYPGRKILIVNRLSSHKN